MRRRHDVIFTDNFQFAFLDREKPFFAQTKASSQLTKNLIFMGSKMTSQLSLDCINLFSAIFQTLIIAETREIAFLRILLCSFYKKNTLQQFKLK